MKRWIQPNPPPPSTGWQSRAEILREHLASLSPLELLRVRPDLYAQTWGWDFKNKRYASGRLALYEELERRAGFNPNQPRVPAGNSDGGQWTSEGSGSPADVGRTRTPQTMTDETDFPTRIGQQYAAGPRGPRDRLPPLHPPIPGAGEGVVSTYRAGQVTIANNAQTGMSTVDETTEKLRTILEKVLNSRGEGYGPEYGTAIHKDFADAVRDANLRGIGRPGVERTYGRGPDDPYGAKDSIRTDVILRNEIGDPIAIYDVKTGSATLRAGRVQELRGKTGADLSVPVIEMHVLRGLTLKARAGQAKYTWLITIRLWNPWVRRV